MSRRKKIDPSILEASEQFDAQAFVEAMQAYLPVIADSSQSTIHLKLK